jgi:hypothetical protein
MPYPSTSMDPKQNSIFYFTFWLCSPMIMGHQVCACSISDFGNMAGSKRNAWPNIAYEAFQTLTTIKWKGIKRNKKKTWEQYREAISEEVDTDCFEN